MVLTWYYVRQMYPDSPNLNYEDDTTVAFFSLPFEALNNWSAHRVKLWGKEFQTAEAAYQFAKFRETAPTVAKQIANAPSPYAVFQISRANKHYTPNDWDTRKISVMTEVVRAKLEQNEDVCERLITTGDRIVAENSPWDDFWGLGSDGNGQNQLGNIWMQLRGEITNPS